ncbi:Rrf2 family transcriptional regulator [Paraburkholderia sp. Ac-20336]|uniref:RrF2 family transcriptional regulator n=1 Tax=Burkholderiaceae TaxID=119060 RepID=UPI001423924C|nr:MULTISPECIES: Rrf2 family transcriptional regulator [Burkholderiaceae]MBN3802359.1 Rrf2 family transcriptional regulator [Paraburkholderia sp. Ac-20336]MBN3845911.1 Rrf2 family transcriptional regulator [Paraburkholderia sp. Ac-20342]NIF55053.1 Rrf2 family transcriptional regulator [Burkholderia sp. Ax-1724]NIF77314.1 Rrf2 family transcriptional regulator [Paraburkholderia sp. Cy-641]
MKLTDYTDYSLRVLIYVAVHPDEPVTIQQISDAFSIPKNHLVKIVQNLGQKGYLLTMRGRSGGIRLGRPAVDINLKEVVCATEPDFGMVECFRDGNRCVITRVCGLRGVLHRALQAYLDVLDGYSLQDLVEKPTAINRTLSLGIPVEDIRLASRKPR